MGKAIDGNLINFFAKRANVSRLGRSYRMFDDKYVDYDNATEQCRNLGARLPVLDTEETIEIVIDYMKEYNFSVFEVSVL